MATTAEERELLFDRQRERLRLLKGVMAQYNTLPKDRRTKGVIGTLVKTVDSTWAEYHAAHGEILRRVPAMERSALPYFTELEYDTAHEVYVLHRGVLLDFLDVFPEKKVSTQTTATTRRIPEYTAPTFDGNVNNWVKFRDLFNSDIRANSSIANAEKLSILVGCLSGNAADVIADIDLSSGNFAAAWKALTEWYDDPALLVSTYMRQLITIPAVTEGTLSELQRIYHTTKAHVGKLRVLEREVDHWDDWLSEMTLMRLDAHSLELWESQRGATRLPPTYDEVMNFLKTRINALERSNTTQNFTVSSNSSSTSKPKESKQHGEKQHGETKKSSRNGDGAHAKSHTAHRGKEKAISCVLCKGQHRLMDCKEFLEKSIAQRLEIVQKKGRCINCLGHHKIDGCKSLYVCQTCKSRHHTLLHVGSATSDTTEQSRNQGNGHSSYQANRQSEVLTDSRPAPQIAVLLATARIRVRNSAGSEIFARALVDQGSEISFVTENLAQRLHLSRRKGDTRITGIGGATAGSARGIVDIVCLPRFESPITVEVEAYVLHRLTSYKPSCRVFDGEWTHLKGLELADPRYDAADSIDVLLGADVFAEIIMEGLVKGPPNSPIAQSTSFGWILSGAMTSSNAEPSQTTSHQCSIHELASVMEKFWELEEVGDKTTEYTQDEVECEEHFRNTYQRTSDGRFIASLPFKMSTEALGKSRAHAEISLDRMNRKFLRDENFARLYQNFIQEYIDLHHMHEITEDSTGVQSEGYYLSHHGLMQTSANITKMRVVFSGSQPIASGLPLNKILHVGPQLQRTIAEILLSWRVHRIVFGADVEKMYRQVLVNPRDVKWQKILWRLKPDDKIRVFCLDTVTYGLASSAYMAIRCLRQLGIDVKEEHPDIYRLIMEDFYVDDATSGADNLEAAIRLVQLLTEVLKSGGFPLKKWTSNSQELLSIIPVEDRASTTSLLWTQGPSHKALGVTWLPDRDEFTFIDKSDPDCTCTKRSAMSRIAQLFDPLGWLSPLSVRGKIFMRHLWKTKLGWDQPLPLEDQRTWEMYLSELRSVSTVSIPRWLHTSGDCEWIEIHGFSDASKDAYSAAVYIRVKDSRGKVVCNLAAAKTRVTPLSNPPKKQISIARLELCGATLLCRLIKVVQSSLRLGEVPVHLWTDSRVTLYWISQDPGRWLIFVAHRVRQIQELVPGAKWHHIEGELNPADCASRGITIEQLKRHQLWWNGPEILTSSKSTWPDPVPLDVIPDCMEEEIKTTNVTQTSEVWGVIFEFSSLRKLLRFTAWWLRYLERLKCALQKRKNQLTSAETTTGELSTNELENARLFWIRHTQRHEFQTDIELLQSGAPASTRQLVQLTPFVDEHGILRVGGRIKHSLLQYDEIHPIILPAKSALTTLIIDDGHLRTLHGGTQVVLAVLRQKYWVIGGRSAVKSAVHKCIRCIRYRAVAATQKMGDLPSARVQRTDVFANTGIDFAGPFSMRVSRGRGVKSHKGYICVFVCLVTRAVHLEAVSEYTTNAFLAAYRRFVSHHGISSHIFSDQGTNFIGADAELRRMFDQHSQDYQQIFHSLTNMGTAWVFNPPGAPHFGGIWEAAVKSVKYHLRRVIGDHTLTYEEFSTLLCEIAACLNSRPLCALNDDPQDCTPLTPGHFLQQKPPLVVPTPSLMEDKISPLKRWQLLCQSAAHFWTRWREEHLQDLQKRQKWFTVQPSIQVGDLVILKSETLAPSRWPLARVMRTHPGEDGHTRVVTLRTQTTTLQRPITKLIVLPKVRAEEDVEAESHRTSQHDHR